MLLIHTYTPCVEYSDYSPYQSNVLRLLSVPIKWVVNVIIIIVIFVWFLVRAWGLHRVVFVWNIAHDRSGLDVDCHTQINLKVSGGEYPHHNTAAALDDE